MDKRDNVTSHTDLLRSYLVLLCLGKSDYEAIRAMRGMTIILTTHWVSPMHPLQKGCGNAMMKRLKNISTSPIHVR